MSLEDLWNVVNQFVREYYGSGFEEEKLMNVLFSRVAEATGMYAYEVDDDTEELLLTLLSSVSDGYGDVNDITDMLTALLLEMYQTLCPSYPCEVCDER